MREVGHTQVSIPFEPCTTLTCEYLADDGEVPWQLPPNYWEQIAYPAYIRAHTHVFKGGDVENGDLVGDVIDGVTLLEGSAMGIEAMLSKSCGEVLRAATDSLELGSL